MDGTEISSSIGIGFVGVIYFCTDIILLKTIPILSSIRCIPDSKPVPRIGPSPWLCPTCIFRIGNASKL